jgi:hypothetical protein
MSTALQKAAPLKPEVRLGQAIRDYENILSEMDKSRFQVLRYDELPTATDVIKLTAEIDIENSRRRRRCVGPRLTSILQAVQQFSTIPDTIISSSQSPIAGAVWAVAKMTLLMASNYMSYFEGLSRLFMEIGCNCPRYQTFGLLFPHPRVHRALCEYFILVVNLCKQAIVFLQKSVVKQLTLSIASSFDIQFGRLKAELSDAARTIQEEVSLSSKQEQRLERKENSAFRTHLTKVSADSEKRRQLKNKAKFLDACSSDDHEAAWKAAKKTGSSQWLYDKDEYKEWAQMRSRRCGAPVFWGLAKLWSPQAL